MAPAAIPAATRVSTIVTGLLSLAGLNGASSPNPANPVSNPLGAAVWAVFRRIESTFSNRTPDATNDAFSTSEDLAATGNVLANDTDADGDALKATLVGGPQHGALTLSGDGSFTYTPTADYNGTDTFTYSVSDDTGGFHLHGLTGLLSGGGGHSDTATVTLVVTPVNDTPVARNDTYSIAEDSPLTVTGPGVLGNDTDVDNIPGQLSAVLDAGPTHGTLALNANGSFSYTPVADYNGSDLFTYRASDGTIAGTPVAVSITVTPVNDAPTANQDGPFNVTENGSRTFTAAELVGNDTDLDTGDNLKLASVSGAIYGNVVLNDDGRVTYTPIANYTGPAEFTYRVSDSAGALSTGSATVSIIVTSLANHAPSFADPPVIDDIDQDSGVITGRVFAADPDGDIIKYGLAGAPDAVYASVDIDPITGQFTFTPTDLARYRASIDAAHSAFIFGFTASDGAATLTTDYTATIIPQHPDDDGTLDLNDLDTLTEYGTVQVSESDRGQIIAIIGTFTDDKVNNAADAMQVLNRVAGVLGAAGPFAGDILSQTTEFGGQSGGVSERFYRLSQTVNSVPVLGSDVILTTLPDGTVTGVFSGINPAIYNVNTAPASSIDDPTEAVSAAAQILLASMGTPPTDSEKSALFESLTFDPHLVVHALDPESAAALAWMVDVYTTPTPEEPNAQPVDTLPTTVSTRYFIYANGATAGSLLAEDDGVANGWSPSFITATGLPHGDKQMTYTVRIQQDGGSSRMVDAVRSITVYNGVVKEVPNPQGKMVEVGYTPDGNVVTPGFFGGWDPSAVSAMYNMATVYDYYKYKLGWDFLEKVPNPKGIQVGVVDSIDGGSVWNAGLLNFTFGTDSEAAVDAVGHEYTHAVINSIVPKSWHFTGKEGEALDEAYGDIIGNLIEGKNDAGQWLFAEDAADKPWRDMKNPSQSGVVNPGPATVGQSNPDADGHYNATIFDHAAQLMMDDPRTADVSKDTWAQIFYSSLYRLPTNATFLNARNAVIASASGKGLTGDQQDAIAKAFDTVGITDTPPVKIVVTWGGSPNDLDSHLTGPSATGDQTRFHVYYEDPDYFVDGTTDSDTKALAADLDLDDTNGQGPERITIRKLTPGEYTFFVQDYTDRSAETSTALTQSGATVKVYNGISSNPAVFKVDGTSEGTVWTVFKLTISGFPDDGDYSVTITPINGYGYQAPTATTIPAEGVTFPGSMASVATVDTTGTRAIVTSVLQDPSASHLPVAITLIDTTTGKQMGTTRVYRDGVHAEFNPTGTRAVVASYINDPDTVAQYDTMEVVVYDTTTFRQVGTAIALPGFYGANLLFDTSGNRLAVPVSDADGTRVYVIDVNTGAQIGDGVSIPGSLWSSPGFNHDGSRFTAITETANVDSRLAVIDTATGDQVGSTVFFSGRSLGYVNADGSRVMVVDSQWNPDSAEIVVVDTTTGEQVGASINLVGATSGEPLITGQGRAFVTTVADGGTPDATTQLTVIDTKTGSQIAGFTRPGDVSYTVVSADGTRAFFSTGDRYEAGTTSVTVIDTSTGAQIGYTITAPGDTLLAQVNATGTRFTIVTADSNHPESSTTTVAAIDANTGRQVGESLTLPGVPQISPLNFDTDGTHVVFTTRDAMNVNRIAVFNATTGRQIGSTVTLQDSVPMGLGLTADGTRATLTYVQLSGSQLTTHVSVIDTTTGSLIGDTIVIPGYPIKPAQVTGDDTRAVVSAVVSNFDAATNTITAQTIAAVIDMRTGRQIGQTVTLNGMPLSGSLDQGPVQLTPDGKRAIVTTSDFPTAGSDQMVRVSVIDTTTGTQLGYTSVLPGSMSGVAQINAQGTRAIFTTNTVWGGFSGQITTINLTTGRPLIVHDPKHAMV